MFVQSCCIRAMSLYSGKIVELGKSGSIRVKEVAFGQGGCIRANWLFGQSDCIRTELIVFGKSGFIRARWLYLGKSVCIRAK